MQKRNGVCAVPFLCALIPHTLLWCYPQLTNICFLQAGLGEGKLHKGYYDRAIMVTVLGEIPDQLAAMQEVYAALKPEGILSVTEIIFDPHFQSRESVQKVAKAAGFREKKFYGKRLAYTLHFQKW